MEGKITYHQQVSYCGKPGCRRCRDGAGHGPYWYAYQTISGRTVRTYVGKNLPAEAQQDAVVVAASERAADTADISADAVVRLYVLGQFTIEHRETQPRRGNARWQPVNDATLQHQRVRSLLTCLISSSGRKLGREQIIEQLWSDLDFEIANHRLDKAVHSLRQLFEPGRDRIATSDLLLAEHSTLQLADQARLWIDADAFDSMLARARASSDPGKTEQLLQEAMLLYGGEYVPDEHGQPAVKARRESLQRSYIGLLLELADLRIAREAIPAAIDTLDQLLTIDPTGEAAVQRLILLLAQTGRRGEALRVYQRFAALLKQEYRVAPLPETRALYEAARRGSNHQTALVSPASPFADARDGTLSSARDAARPAEAEPRAHMQVGRSNQSKLIGREQEMAALQQMLLHTEQSRGMKLAGQKKSAAPLLLDTRRTPQSLLLMGDVGIGKTRLAEELGREARRRGWTIAWARAYAQETSVPYRLWTESLHRAMSQGLWQRQEVARHPLIYQPLCALLPELEELLPRIEAPAASPEQEQLHLWEATHALLAAISESAPLLIVLDDLQWADNSSCELLSFLARRLRGYPILIAGTCRDIELPSAHPLRAVMNDLQREHAIETITVQPLSDAHIRALVSGLPESVVQHIQLRAAGNPFFAEELARSSHLPSTLPDTIAAVLDLRLGRISSACLRMLSRAAVLGGSFDFKSLRAMENNPAAFDEDAILDLLEEALQTGMITEEGSGTRITYHFWHPLLAGHLYDSLSAGRRASLHRRVAEALRAAHAGRAEEAATITYHLLNGGTDSRDIAHYAELAGDHAYTLSAYPEAARHYRLAVEHIGTLPATATSDDCLRLANLLERLGECTRVLGNDEEARSYYERTLKVREQYRHVAAQLDEQYEAQIDALLWVEIGASWFNAGDFENALRQYSHSESVLQEAAVLGGAAWARLRLDQGYVFWSKGNLEQARQTADEALHMFQGVLEQHYLESIDAFHSTAIRRTLKGDPVDLGRTHTLLAAIAATAGETTTALHHLHTALTIYEQYDRQREIAIVCCNIGDAYLRKTEHSLSQAALRRSLGIAERIGDIPIASVALGNLGMIAARFGNLQDAEIFYRRGLALAEQVNDPIFISQIQGVLTTVIQDQGDLDGAALSSCQALKISRATKFVPSLGVSLVAMGHLRVAQALASQKNPYHVLSVDHQYQRKTSLLFLKRARASLQRALSLEGLETETRTEGQLALAEVSFLLGEIDTAQQQTRQAIDEARRYEQTWLLATGQRLMGSVLSAQEQYEAADASFHEAMETLQKCSMRLEWARTLRSYGESLLKRSQALEDGHKDNYANGMRSLQEARQAFEACHAALDLELADRAIKTPTTALLSMSKFPVMPSSF